MIKNIYYCTCCDKEIKGEVYNLNDEPVCESCFNDAIDRAEMAYESQREDGLNL